MPAPPKRPTKGEGLEALHKERRTGQSYHQSLDAVSDLLFIRAGFVFSRLKILVF